MKKITFESFMLSFTMTICIILTVLCTILHGVESDKVDGNPILMIALAYIFAIVAGICIMTLITIREDNKTPTL